MRRTLIAVVLVLAFPFGAGATAPPASGTIAGPFGSAALGSTVTFTTTVSGFKGWQYPMVDLVCEQAGTVVFAQLDYPDAIFLLGGGSSDWSAGGGDAECHADLDLYGRQGGRWHVDTVATTGVWTAAG